MEGVYMANKKVDVLIQAIIQAKDVQARLNAIKDLNVKIQKLKLDPSAIEALKKQLNRNGIDVKLALDSSSQLKFEEAAKQYSKTLNAASEETDAFVKKQKKVIGQLQNTLSSVPSVPSVFQEQNTASPNKQKSMGESANETAASSGKLSNLLKDQFTEAAHSLSQLFSVGSIVTDSISKVKESLSELKTMDTYLTQISKANEQLSKSDLAQIGKDSFTIADKYGKKAVNYLSGVQEMSLAGYPNADKLAELSTAAQSAGDLTEQLANNYILAADKAWRLEGSVHKLTDVLDGSFAVTSHNAVHMTDLAEGMEIISSQAANTGIEVKEMTSALAAVMTSTQLSGSDTAQAFQEILHNLQQVTDAEKGIDAEGLHTFEKACASLNVSLKETKNGITSLRNPMEILEDLAGAYTKLGADSPERKNLLSSVGEGNQSNVLDGLLSHWDTYEKMLGEYAQGAGSMTREAQKTANSWEGSLNRLSNTWTDTVGNVANSDGIITAINGLNGLLGVINKITEKLETFGTIGAAIGAGLGAKNIGKYA